MMNTIQYLIDVSAMGELTGLQYRRGYKPSWRHLSFNFPAPRRWWHWQSSTNY